MTDPGSRPLDGVRVIDCTQMLSGPFATQMLADMGATVIKIERPETGDITRAIEPTVGDSGMTSYFASLNRGKRSVVLDLSSPQGADALARLAADADVIVENYRAGLMEEWGLGYDSLSELSDDLIYCSISGFGPGPYEDVPAFDMVVQALGGSMSITGESDGQPLRSGLPIGDICAGMYAVIGIVTALHSVDRHGGQRIDVPMFEGLVSWLSERAGWTFATGEPYQRRGNVHPSLAPYRVFDTEDGWLALAIGSQGTWLSLCEALDRPDLAADPRFETNSDRVANRAALASELADVFVQDDAESWFERLREASVPAAPVNDTAEVFETPQIRASEATSDLTLGGVDMPFVEFPVGFSELRSGDVSEPPVHGEHTRTVLSEVMDEAAVDDLMGE
ncbi:CaiB/BaiF CoA transferase family protein [Natronomonas marina]|uniref:CaiB/BaiF CoA transferase family protein n=1 Tax=Natronomonas marina TaxID=2961939 RepID=UPI0020C9DFE8|nr:CaiB/BaiF CoA-transferase family protein [Natronomonas marina]